MGTALALSVMKKLDPIAKRIERHHKAAEQGAKDSIEQARQAGKLLLEAKEKVPHGSWTKWVETNCRIKERSSQLYMRLAERWDDITSKAQPVALLGLRDALSLVTEPRPEPTEKEKQLQKVMAEMPAEEKVVVRAEQEEKAGAEETRPSSGGRDLVDVLKAAIAKAQKIAAKEEFDSPEFGDIDIKDVRAALATAAVAAGL